MKWWISLCLVSMVGCATDVTPPVAASVEAVVADCTPGGNYPGATLPPTPFFAGKGPSAGPTQMFVVYPDPTVQGEHVVYLADYVAGKLVWGARVKSSNLPVLAAWLANKPMIMGPNPPPPPPICGGCGDGYYARFPLELTLRAAPLAAQAAQAAAIIPPPQK